MYFTNLRDKDIATAINQRIGSIVVGSPELNRDRIPHIDQIVRVIDQLMVALKRTTKEEVKCVNLLCHDSTHKRIMYDKKELELSKKEYKLLLLLMQHANFPVPKEMIIDTLWSSSEGGSDGAIRVYINRIKHLLPHITIQNIRAVGYKLVS